MINGNENEAKNKNRSQRQDMNWPRWPRHGHRYTKYKMCLSVATVYVLSNT